MNNHRNILSILIIGTSLLLSSCGTYRSGFSCGDAKGANCYPMDKIDQYISTGQIEEFADNPGRRKCRGRRCRTIAAGRGGVSGNDLLFNNDVSDLKIKNSSYDKKGRKIDIYSEDLGYGEHIEFYESDLDYFESSENT